MSTNRANNLALLAGKPASAPERVEVSRVMPSGDSIRAFAKIVAGYDAAKTTPSNQRHWADADGLSAASANSEQVRGVLRRRSRFEWMNNSYYQGMVSTVCDDTIGTGPRAHVRTEIEQTDTDKEVQYLFTEFCDSRRICEKLWTARSSKIVSGEVFPVFGRRSRRRTRRGVGTLIGELPDVELDLKLLECDQVAHPMLTEPLRAGEVSGIRYDSWGEPIAYHILDHHPGDRESFGSGLAKGRWVSADDVLHYYKPLRPGDARGVPETTAALDLFALHRRFRIATVEAAEHMANIAGLLYTDGPAWAGADEDLKAEAFDVVEFVRGALMTLPAGWKYTQPDAKQPQATFSEFSNAIVAEIARTLRLPFNVASGDSSKLNYASGRMDYQIYHKSIYGERNLIEHRILLPIFTAWYAEAALVSGYLPQKARQTGYAKKLFRNLSWHWDGFGHVDPVKEANAEAIELENGTATLRDIAAKKGKDWRDLVDQVAVERAYRDSKGVPQPLYARAPAPAPAMGLPGGSPETDESNQNQDEDEE